MPSREQKYIPEQIADLEKSRTISDAELLKKGNEYQIDSEGNKTLVVPAELSLEIAGKVNKGRKPMSPEKLAALKERSRERFKKMWQDPEWAKAHKKMSSDRMKKLNNDPEFAERRDDKARKMMKEMNKDPEVVKAKSERMRQQRKDPEFNRLNAEALRGKEISPQARAVITARLKDPEFIKKRQEGYRRYCEDRLRTRNGHIKFLESIGIRPYFNFGSRQWEPATFRTPASMLAEKERADQIQDAIMHLPVIQRELVVQSMLEEKTLPEISADTGLD